MQKVEVESAWDQGSIDTTRGTGARWLAVGGPLGGPLGGNFITGRVIADLKYLV